jgi:tRNA pseudouridine38-40 synthase
VGRGRLSPEGFVEIMHGKDRRRAGMTAPAHGLFLVDVKYDSNDEQGSHGGVEDEAR